MPKQHHKRRHLVRKLTGMTDGSKTISFLYDENGQRIEKTVTENSVTATTKYTVSGKSVTHVIKGTEDLHIFYANGQPSHCKYGNNMYTFVYSLQGDVLGLKDNTGALVVTYLYDAWGNIISAGGTLASTLGSINPFRYRGYVYDVETGLYYLRSRYYDPEKLRFISPDQMLGQTGKLLVHNMFSYCRNDSENHVDYDGAEDRIYRSFSDMHIENIGFFHDFYYGVRNYVEVDGVRYRANSYETVSLYDWNTVDTSFMETRFYEMIDEAAEYADIESVFRESIGGELDFKNKLEDELYLLDGVVYNRYEAGNFLWAYYLKEHGYIDLFQGILAQGGSLFGGMIKMVIIKAFIL